MILFRVITTTKELGYTYVLDTTGDFARIVQTISVLEIVHSATGKKIFIYYFIFLKHGKGLVRAPIFTTAMQVVSRLNSVWGVCYLFPHIVGRSPAYTSMLVAWSLTEIIRYSFYALNLLNAVWDSLIWLRLDIYMIIYTSSLF